MSSSTAEFPERTPPSGDFDSRIAEAVIQLDKTRSAYFEACEQYVGKQGERQEALLSTSQRSYGNAFHGFLNTVREDMNGQQFGMNAFDFFIHEDTTRVGRLNVLLGGEKIKPVTIAGNTPENVEAAMAQTGDEETYKVTVIGELLNVFSSCLARDATLLITEMDTKEKPRWKRIGEAVGWHALDVGKTAVGTLAGVAIMQLLNSSRKR